MSPHLRYSPDVDIIYVRLTDRQSVESDEETPGIVTDFDADGNVVGYEIFDASRVVENWPTP